MTLEIKAILALVLLLGLVGFGFWGYRSAYGSGQTAGKAEVQGAWDRDKAAIQALTTDAIAQAMKDKDAALIANEGVRHDLQTQVDSARAIAGNLAQRLRIATARSASNSGPVSQAGPRQGAATTVPASSNDAITVAIANALTECAVNADNHDALIKELTPQL
jgi:hypothetical protein